MLQIRVRLGERRKEVFRIRRRGSGERGSELETAALPLPLLILSGRPQISKAICRLLFFSFGSSYHIGSVNENPASGIGASFLDTLALRSIPNPNRDVKLC